MKRVFSLVPVVLVAVFSFSGLMNCASQECENGVCRVPLAGKANESRYAVFSPIGSGTIPMIKQAPRLDSLDGKTIAIVGGSFMAYVTHPELKRLILEKYPTAKVLVLNEIGSAGPWPGPGVVRREKDEFQQKLKQMGVQAVISGNGGCGLCTPKEMGSCIAAEYMGIPSVMIAAPGFVTQARKAAQTAGVPVPRVAEYPGAFAAHSREELIENTRKVLWPQILAALTKPFTKEEKAAADKDANVPDDAVVFTGSLAEVQHLFNENGWTDGLPIVPPTKERVAEFLKYTDHDADEEIGTLPVAYRKVTVRKVAVNGVMAGCPPEFMPILIAFTRAMGNGDFRRTLASTHAWTPFCWLNGPVARQLGIDSTQGEISVQRNAVIGRFINLAMLNLGGYYVKENRMGTFGYLMPWCLVEDDAAAIALGWKPWHMQQGHALNDSTLTAASALSWGNNLAPATSDARKIMEMMAWDAVEKEQFALGSGTPFVYRTMLVTGYVARDLATVYKTKEDLEHALIETARRPLEERAYANYWGNPGSAFNPEQYPLSRHMKKLGSAEGAAQTQTPPWLAWSGLENIETVPVMTEGKTAILITGDENRNKTMCVPGGGFATIPIELSEKWDELTAELGYKPLAEFHLNSKLQPSKAPQRSTTRRQPASGKANGRQFPRETNGRQFQRETNGRQFPREKMRNPASNENQQETPRNPAMRRSRRPDSNGSPRMPGSPRTPQNRRNTDE